MSTTTFTAASTASVPRTSQRVRSSGQATFHARWAAAAAGAGVVVHLAMASAGGVMAAAAVVMAIACVPCASGLWRAPSVRSARVLVGMSLGMALLHGALLLGAAPALGHAGMAGMSGSGAAPAPTSHAASSLPASGETRGSTDGDALMLAAMGTDFTAAMLAASWIRRSALA
ncbi:hypothetical protein [Sinomonas terrae]|uniref:Uncharacterized protein n=1 Tax=Sinomonas terrae TaxID=2908838 RepID=A0ABS9TZE4_9MICC|nr:hypothetical protein [Sinomonas terrae]MCH6469804.1 hypothetical protein [Sinomonas terrae]